MGKNKERSPRVKCTGLGAVLTFSEVLFEYTGISESGQYACSQTLAWTDVSDGFPGNKVGKKHKGISWTLVCKH